MIIVSINLNKRLGNIIAKNRFEKWLEDNDVDLILCQEPWALKKPIPLILKYFEDLGGSDHTRVWIRRKWIKPKVVKIMGNWQEIDLDYLCLYNVYLSAYSTEERIDFLQNITSYIKDKISKPVIILGDFNIAPNAQDGLINNYESKFNSPMERFFLKDLLDKNELIDFSISFITNENKFTIERKNKKFVSRFRCDLALITRYLCFYIKGHYDHNVRIGPDSFTDHSAILLDIPITLAKSDYKTLDLFEEIEPDFKISAYQYKPQNTAISRNEPSTVAKMVFNRFLSNNRHFELLDYGCGYGIDVKWYNNMKINAEGWDPSEKFGFTKLPQKKYDIVTCVFVLNVLSNPYERFVTLTKALSLVKTGGRLIIATRSPETIDKEALRKKWIKHNDGYWSSEAKNTFQKGIGMQEIENLLKHINHAIDPISHELDPISDTVVAVTLKLQHQTF